MDPNYNMKSFLNQLLAERMGMVRPITTSVGGVSCPHSHVEGGCQKKVRVSAKEEKRGMTDRCQLISKNILSVMEIICSRHDN